MTNSYGVDKAISDVPKELINDLGLQYNRLKWRTRRNRLEGSLEILRKFHGEETLVYPEFWWKLRENITRDLIYEKKYFNYWFRVFFPISCMLLSKNGA